MIRGTYSTETNYIWVLWRAPAKNKRLQHLCIPANMAHPSEWKSISFLSKYLSCVDTVTYMVIYAKYALKWQYYLQTVDLSHFYPVLGIVWPPAQSSRLCRWNTLPKIYPFSRISNAYLVTNVKYAIWILLKIIIFWDTLPQFYSNPHYGGQLFFSQIVRLE